MEELSLFLGENPKKLSPYYLLARVTVFLLLLVTVGSFALKDIYVPFVPASLIPEVYGQDLLSLLAIPVLVSMLVVVKRNSVRGLILLAGILLYVVYAYALYAFGGIYNGFFLVYIALVGIPLYAVIGITTHVQGKAFRSHLKANFPEKVISMYLMIVAGLVGAVWMVTIVHTIAAKKLTEGINTVYILDLAFLLPAFVVVAIQLWQRKPWSYFLSGILLVKVVTLGSSIILGKIFAYAHGEILSIGRVSLFGILTFSGLMILMIYLHNVQE